ncbi:MAG: aspartyl protease family protein [Bacteroidota bacterium]
MRNLIALLFIACFQIAHAQDVKSKDGISLGKRSDFIMACVKGANKKLMNLNGLEIETEKYCSCVCDNLIPQINSWEMEEAAKKNKMTDLFLKDDNLKILMDCLEGNYTISDDYKFGKGENSDLQIKVGIKNCVSELMNDSAAKEIWTEEMANEYCSCAVEKLFKSGYTYKDLQEIENENSPIYNEIALPCISAVFNKSTESAFSVKNTYAASDISGGGKMCNVPLTDYLGKGFKVKITLDGITRYFLFDTGATDLIIDSDTERELLLNGSIKREDYLGEKEYTMANGQTAKARLVNVNRLVIGDYSVNNVVIGVIKEGSLLCGKSFLDKFRKWELNKDAMKLILYK